MPRLDHAAFVRDLGHSVESLMILVDVAQHDINRLFDEYGASQAEVYATAAVRAIERLGPCYGIGPLSFATIAPLSNEEGRARLEAFLPWVVPVDVAGARYDAVVPWRMASAIYDGRPPAEFDAALAQQLRFVAPQGRTAAGALPSDVDGPSRDRRRDAHIELNIGDFDQRPMMATANTSDIDALAARAEALNETEVRAIAAAWELLQHDQERADLVNLGITLAYARVSCGSAADAVESALRAAVDPWRASLDDVPVIEQMAVAAARTHAIAVAAAGVLPPPIPAVMSQSWRQGLREAATRP